MGLDCEARRVAPVEDGSGAGMTMNSLRLGSLFVEQICPADGSGRDPQSSLPVYRGTAFPRQGRRGAGSEGDLPDSMKKCRIGRQM